MRLLDRDVRRIAVAGFDRRHWRALWNMFNTFDDPFQALTRYLRNAGAYPWVVRLSTPLGVVPLVLDDRHDLLTVNEIFCRRDYGDGDEATVVVDVGANVGLASLFFLTRSPRSRTYCYEPDPANVERLVRNLKGFEDRYELSTKAVTAEPSTEIRFVPAGRYGRTALPNEDCVIFPAVGAARLLSDVVAREGRIDLVKVDTEGSELALLAEIRRSPHAGAVGCVVYEDNAGRTRWAHPAKSMSNPESRPDS